MLHKMPIFYFCNDKVFLYWTKASIPYRHQSTGGAMAVWELRTNAMFPLTKQVIHRQFPATATEAESENVAMIPGGRYRYRIHDAGYRIES